MKLKEFKETEAFTKANIVEYYNQDEQEIVITTQVNWRRLQNKEIINHESRIDPETGLNILTLTIQN